ncbi:MAG: C25 family cysteine peptidase, partial [candidate division WOR-3 bacterium]
MRKFVFLTLVLFLVTNAQEIGAKYLIITHDNFVNDIQPLAQWKHKKGMRTKVVTLSQIGSSSSQIKSYIQTAYNTWQIPPEFVLLVGAPNLLPWGQSYSDNYYMEMTGDLFNDVLAGRLTVHNNTEAQTVVNKILLYERNPHMMDSLWMTNACLIVREDYDQYDDSIYWSDANHAKNLMLANGYNIIDTLSRAAGNNANDIIQSVNNGRAFVMFRGQGVGNWWSPFGVNPDLTANGEKLPIVLSITCRTIGTGSTPAEAERWLLTGSPTNPRGGVGYFATTTTLSGGAHLRSATAKGFFNGVFVERKKTFGEACETGRLNVYNLYGNTSEYRGFATLGDPEMNI